MATVLTDVGEEWAVDRMVSGAGTQNDAPWVAWGTGAGTAAKGDTTLFTEASEARVSGTVTKDGAGSAAKYQVVGTITSDGTKTITNAGNFTASTAGNLVVKGDFTGIPLESGDKIEFTITLDPS